MVVDPSARVDSITQVVQSHVSEGKLDRSHGKELTYTLPIAAVGNFAGREGLISNFDLSKKFDVCKITWSSFNLMDIFKPV